MNKISEGWERHRRMADPNEVATQKQLRLMKLSFYAGYAHALKMVVGRGGEVDAAFIASAMREGNELVRSGE